MILSPGYQTTLDRCGVVMAGLCVLHCAILPFTLILLPVVGAYYENAEWLHAPLALAAVAVCLTAMITGWYRHNSWRPWVLGTIGILLLLASLAEEQLGELAEYVATVGALFAASAHWSNIRATSRGTACAASRS